MWLKTRLSSSEQRNHCYMEMPKMMLCKENKIYDDQELGKKTNNLRCQSFSVRFRFINLSGLHLHYSSKDINKDFIASKSKISDHVMSMQKPQPIIHKLFPTQEISQMTFCFYYSYLFDGKRLRLDIFKAFQLCYSSIPLHT